MSLKRDTKTTKSQYIAKWIIFAIYTIYSLTLLYPIVWTLVCSLCTPEAFQDGYGKIFPSLDNITFANYQKYFSHKTIVRTGNGIVKQFTIFDMIGNTIFLTVARAVISMAFSVCASYCCARYKFLGSGFFFFYGVVFCSIPFYGGTAASFKFWHSLGLYDTVWAVLLMSIAPYNSFLFLYGFFRGLDQGYSEAATLDGANDFQVFVLIMLPQVMPILATFLVGGFIGAWQDWSTNYMWLPSMPMIAYSIYTLSNNLAVKGDYTTFFAASVFSMACTGTFFVIFRKRILATVYTGGLKG